MITEIQEAQAFALTLTATAGIAFVLASMLIATGAMIPNNENFYAGMVETALSLQFETREVITNAIESGQKVLNFGLDIWNDVYNTFQNTVDFAVGATHLYVSNITGDYGMSISGVGGSIEYFQHGMLRVETHNHTFDIIFPIVGQTYIFTCVEAIYLFERFTNHVEFTMYVKSWLWSPAQTMSFGIGEAIMTRTITHTPTDVSVNALWYDGWNSLILPLGVGNIYHGGESAFISKNVSVNPVISPRVWDTSSVEISTPATWNPETQIINPLVVPLSTDTLLGVTSVSYPDFVVTHVGDVSVPIVPIVPEGFFEGVLSWLAELWSAIMSIPLSIVSAINNVGDIVLQIPIILRNILDGIISIPLTIVNTLNGIWDTIRDIPIALSSVLTGLNTLVSTITTSLVGDVTSVRLPDLTYVITDRFPFSLPFDIAYVISGIFQRHEIHPFEFELYNPVGNNVVIRLDLFSAFPQLNGLLQFIRIGLGLLFMISMIYATPKLFGGAQ